MNGPQQAEPGDPTETTVFQLNDKALVELQKGNYCQARLLFERALAALRETAQDPSGFRKSNRSGYGSQADNEIVQDVSITNMPIDSNQTSFTQPSSAVENTIGDTLLFQLFEYAFTTPFWNYQGTRGIHLTFAFLCYNLALCHHHQQLKEGTMNYGTAIQLYNTAITTITQAMGDGRPEDVVVLMMALFNNLGHIYSHLGMLDPAKDCITKLRTIAMSIPWEHSHRFNQEVYAFFQTAGIPVPDAIFNKAPAA